MLLRSLPGHTRCGLLSLAGNRLATSLDACVPCLAEVVCLVSIWVYCAATSNPCRFICHSWDRMLHQIHTLLLPCIHSVTSTLQYLLPVLVAAQRVLAHLVHPSPPHSSTPRLSRQQHGRLYHGRGKLATHRTCSSVANGLASVELVNVGRLLHMSAGWTLMACRCPRGGVPRGGSTRSTCHLCVSLIRHQMYRRAAGAPTWK